MRRLQRICFFILVASIAGCATAKPTAPPAPLPVASVSASIAPLFYDLVTHLIKEVPSLVNQKIAVGELTE